MKTLSRALSPVALFAWGALMLYFYVSGRLNAYLIPMYRPGVVVAGVVMLAIAVGQLYSLRFGARWQAASGLFADGADELSSPRRVWLTQLLAFGLLVVPIWAATGMSKDGFTASTVLNRGIVSDAAGLPGKSAAAPAAAVAAKASNAPASAAPAVYEPPLPGATPVPANAAPDMNADAAQYLKKTADGHIIAEVTDLLFASEDDTMRPLFENHTIEMIGQFLPVKDSAEGRFQLVRMFMVCCAADARPVGVQSVPPPAVKGEAVKLPQEMAWTKVVGTVTFPMENGRRIPLVHAQTVTPTDPPAEAMLY